MIPDSQAAVIDAIARTAEAWGEEDAPSRATAVQKTLEAPNRFTEEGLTHALNHQMGRLTREVLQIWLDDAWTDEARPVGVLSAGEVPLDGLRDLLAVWGTGHVPLVTTSEASPHLLPAFAHAATQHEPSLDIEFVEEGALFQRAEALLAQPPSDTLDAVHDQCEAHGIPPANRHIRPPVFSVGILDGQESEEEREDLAADMLLYEGMGRPRLALLWAPEGLSPDPYLEAMAQFRGAVPAHPDTPGALQMQQAFLEAKDVSHAYAVGLQFLVSRADPDVQPPGHIRWTEYADLDDALDWIQDHPERLYSIVAREGLHDRLPPVAPVLGPGQVHGAPLDDEEGERTLRFLRRLSETGGRP